jgi:hypothetical protein
MYARVSIPELFAAWIVKVYEPGVVGVPEYVPLIASTVNPGGNEPALTLQVILPPEAMKLAL